MFGVQYDKLLKVLENSHLPFGYRASICRLLRVLYIDREPNEDIPALNFTRIWNDVSVKDPMPSPWLKADPWMNFRSLAPTAGFTDLRALFTDFFAVNGSFKAHEMTKNELTMEYLATANMLLRYGVYFNGDTVNPEFQVKRDLKKIGAELLDGMLGLLGTQGEMIDEHGNANPTAAFEHDGFTMLIAAKLDCVKIITYIFDCRQEERVRLAFDMYEKCAAQVVQLDRDKRGYRKDIDGEEFKLRPLTGEMVEPKALSYLADKLFKQPILSKKVMRETDPLSPSAFVNDLLILCTYPHAGFIKTVFGLLYRHYDQPSLFIKNMLAQQVVVLPDIAASIPLLAADVSEVRRNLKWISAPADSARALAYTRVPLILRYWTSLCTLGAVVRVGGDPYRNIGGAEITITREEVLKFQNILRSSQAHITCYPYIKVPIKSNILEPSVALMKQKFADFICKDNPDLATSKDEMLLMPDAFKKLAADILRDSGLDAEHIPEIQGTSDQILQQVLDDPTTPNCRPGWRAGDPMDFRTFNGKITALFRTHSEPQFKSLLNDIFKFLAAFVNGHKQNQVIISTELQWFQVHIGVQGIDYGVANVLRSLLSANKELCDVVDENILDDVMRHLKHVKEPEWLMYLKDAILTTTVNDLGKTQVKPQMRNSAIVMEGIQSLNFLDKWFLANKDYDWANLSADLLDETNCCLKTENVISLNYHTASIAVLAALCEGALIQSFLNDTSDVIVVICQPRLCS